MPNFEAKLTGGHPNSLGNTEVVVAEVLANPKYFDELFHCYFSEDEVVRLRVSSAMKRIAKADKQLIVPYFDRFLTEIATINQASTQWTLAQLFNWLKKEMTPAQMQQAQHIMQQNLETQKDWIVLNMTMQTLAEWAQKDAALKDWLMPHLQDLRSDSRKSVARRAKKYLDLLGCS